MLKTLKNYILDSDFRLILLDGKINVVNYIDIDHFDDKKIIIKYRKGYITINGDNLIISKLLTDEILITGKIKGLNFND